MLRLLSILLFVLMFCWALGLAVFVHGLPMRATPSSVRTDAIIVLTGGNARVERGFAMLAQGAAPVLLISGVGKDVTLQEMLHEHANETIRENIRARGASIVLDHVALTTQTNAREAAQFVRERDFHSIRLITAHYHMPRSMAEMQNALPDVEIVADPVFPAGFRRDQWWRHKTSRDLILSEYHKSLAVLFRPIVQRFQ